MRVFTTIKGIRDYLKTQNKTIAFVPTMGALHAGHLSLIESGKKNGDIVVVSIFINPAQFAENEDFHRYPQTLSQDKKTLNQYGVDVLFAPSADSIYPENQAIMTVDTGHLGKILCGQFRPHFFNGVALVLIKLFNIIRPQVVVFGQKDYQQLLVVKALIHYFNYDIKMVMVATIREKDGLAMSSRNQYLSAEQRLIAPKFYQILSQTNNDEQDTAEKLKNYFHLDYVAILDADNLKKITGKSKRFIVVSAVWLGKTRLIDNIIKPLKK